MAVDDLRSEGNVPVVSCSGLTMQFGRRLVLDQVQLTIASGERVALVGPNGSGKSTLLRLLAGLSAPSRGSLKVLGEQTPVALASRRHVGVMLQGGHTEPFATPRHHLERLRPWHDEERSTDEVLTSVELPTQGDVKVRDLSEGERQRLALATALLGRPRLLLLDEPTSAMDAASRSMAWRLIQDVAGDGGVVVYATHSRSEIAALATRVVTLENGTIGADTSASVYLYDPPVAIKLGPGTSH